jgi:hypothetical protein
LRKPCNLSCARWGAPSHFPSGIKGVHDSPR